MLRKDKEEIKDFREERENKHRERRFNKNTEKVRNIKRGILKENVSREA